MSGHKGQEVLTVQIHTSLRTTVGAKFMNTSLNLHVFQLVFSTSNQINIQQQLIHRKY